ncbi:acyltransferase family protein, partial [Pseudomonas viridiflava]|uniref:acyltransferase family protein n=1 Tax=Pseudomonas viridiflava TaxID=33069 RepID=UPI0013E03711
PYSLEFIIGVALALFFYSRHSTRLPTAAVWGLLAVALLAGVPLIAAYRLYDSQGLLRMLMVGGTFGLLVLTLALLERRQKIFVPTPLVVVGDMSYTIYLSHLLVLGVIGRVWSGVGAWPESYLDNLFFATLMVAATLCYGWVGYRCFEKPVLDRANAFGKR